MINRAVIAAQVAGGRRICWLVGNVLVGLESYVQDACFMTPRVPAKENIKQWHEGQQPKESRYIMNTLSFPSNFFFSYPIKSKTVPTPCCSLRPAAGPVAGVNWDNCMVWGWATAMPVQLFVSWGNRVAHTFHRDFAGSRVLGMYNGFCLSKELPSCWIRCVVFCQQPLL